MRVLNADDLVPDEPLGARKGNIDAKDDLLHHRVLAKRTAELALSAKGNVNIALFGPWGSGKSSFNALLREELSKSSIKTRHITFDSWKNAGAGFRTNFLSEVAKQVNANVKISDELFQSTSSVRGPLANLQWSLRRRITTLVGFLAVVFFGLPLGWTIAQLIFGAKRDFFALFSENVGGFGSMAASGTLFVVVALAVIELSKVTVSKSTPSYVAQFDKLFQEILDTKKKHRFIIFIDELDRCSPKDVMATLEGLRTFLGDSRCVFVVAFDREAVAGVIANELAQNAPRENAAPYYRTSGEYLDKIFQFQLALPPQPVHTFRRFASSLVRDRGGVWAELRGQSPDLLDRVVNILSPMHLASPRRTKVLLNDFAVNARVYEGMGFMWLERAEEIAVLTVLQTEFPRLAAELEREPALMRFLYREETPTRASLKTLVEQYSEHGKAGNAPLDEVVGEDDDGEVAGQLDDNLRQYLRLLRERHVPEPRADLIMMHSDGSPLLAFNDAGIYHELLSAADMPRQDVIAALDGATEHDLGEAIRYLLDQTEKEPKCVSDGLIVLAGEIAAQLPSIEPDLARVLVGRVSSSVSRMSTISLRGYGAAVSVAYSPTEMQTLLQVAADQIGADVVQVIRPLVDQLSDADWENARQYMLPLVLQHATSVPDVAAAFFIRFSQDLEAELTGDQIKSLAADLTAEEPAPVEPASTSAAAKTAAEEEDAENAAAYEAQRAAYRAVAEELTVGWAEMVLGSEVRRDILRVLRRVEKLKGFLDLHDALILRDIERGQLAEANLLLLTAIQDRPRLARRRWGNLLDKNAAVPAASKRAALEAILKMLFDETNETRRDEAAIVALQIAELESNDFDRATVDNLVRGDLATDWEEYSDSRFETQLRLLAVLDALNSAEPLDGTAERRTDSDRIQLYLTAVRTAQAEGASVDILVAAIERERCDLAAVLAEELAEDEPWGQKSPELPVRVILAAQHRALAGGESTAHLPTDALLAINDTKMSRALAASWLSTTPPAAELERFPNASTLPQESWRDYGRNATEVQRGEVWRFLMRKQAGIDQLRALSESGQALDIYEGTAAAAREAKTRPPRERAVKAFLALPVRSDAAGEVRAMVKVMAQDKKRTELAWGVLLLRAYIGELSDATVRALRPLVSKWAEEGEGLVARRDLTWLVDHGFATRSSSLWETLKRTYKRT